MIDGNHIRQIYDRYSAMVTKGDVEGIVALYAEDATIEDPIGSDLHRGSEGVRAFYQASDIYKLNRGGNLFLRFNDFRQFVQTQVRHLNNADIRINGAERIVLRINPGLG